MNSLFHTNLFHLLIALFLFSCQGNGRHVRSQGVADEKEDDGLKADAGFTGITFQKRGIFEVVFFGTKVASDEKIDELLICEFTDRDYETLEEAFQLSRYKSPSYGDYFQLMTQIVYAGTEHETIQINGFSYEYTRRVNEKTSMRLSGSGREDAFISTVSNYSYEDGIARFDFEIVVDSTHNNTKKEMILRGKFDSGTSKIYRDVATGQASRVKGKLTSRAQM